MSLSNKRITVVIDTNVFVSCLSSKSQYHNVFRSLLDGKYDLHISSDILLEYEEQITKRYDVETSELFLTALNELPNVHRQEVFFQWGLILVDRDDNKFIDCSLVANADYLVTNDRHFDVVKNLDYPKVNIITIDDFVKICDAL